MNATHLFDREGCSVGLAPSSESFWTTVFTLFLLYLGSPAGPATGRLDVWEPTGTRPWFRRKSTPMHVAGLTFDDLAVESSRVAELWRVDNTVGGVCPDVILRLHQGFAMVEVKVRTHRSVNDNQELMYPALAELLRERQVSCTFFILMSIGHQPPLYRKATLLNTRLGDAFGLLLWEDVFRCMRASGFQLPGLDVERLMPFTEDAGSDCVQW